MIRPLICYPDPTIRLISGNVRFFDEQLQEYITDMIDTMQANNLEILSAILIGIQYNIIVIKEEDGYHPYINSRLIKEADKTEFTERSLYYPGISVNVDRYAKATVVYEDVHGYQQSKELEGEEARRFQQYLDYCFGSTFVDRVDKEMKQRINDHLEFGLVEGGGSCPTVFYRDYFKKAANIFLLIVLASLIIPLIAPSFRETFYLIDQILLSGVVVLTITYAIYARYESEKYKQCTSCQTGNAIGTIAILGSKTIVLGLLNWLILG